MDVMSSYGSGSPTTQLSSTLRPLTWLALLSFSRALQICQTCTLQSCKKFSLLPQATDLLSLLHLRQAIQCFPPRLHSDNLPRTPPLSKFTPQNVYVGLHTLMVEAA